MKKQTIKSLGLALLALVASSSVAQAQTYQLPNVGFENWGTGKSLFTSENTLRDRPGEEPTGWSSQNTKFVGANRKSFCTKQTGNSTYAKLNNKRGGCTAAIVPYNSTLTVGSSWYTVGIYSAVINYEGANNACGKAMDKYAQNGVYGGVDFVGKPDALAGSFMSESRNNGESCHVIAYLWSGTFSADVPAQLKCNESGGLVNKTHTGVINTWMTLENEGHAFMSQMPSWTGRDQSNICKNLSYGNLIAYVDYSRNTTFGWEDLVLEFTYNDNTTIPEKTNVILASCDPWDGQKAVENNSFAADDVRYVYYSRLSDLKVDGTTIEGFDPNTFDYVFYSENPVLPTVDQISYSLMSNSALTSNKHAKVERDEANMAITITVTNDNSIANAEAYDIDGKTSHTYTIRYRKVETKTTTTYVLGNKTDAPNDYVIANISDDANLTFYEGETVGTYPTCDVVLPALSLPRIGLNFGVIALNGANASKDASGTTTLSFDGTDMTFGENTFSSVSFSGAIDASNKCDFTLDLLLNGVTYQFVYKPEYQQEHISGYYYVAPSADHTNPYIEKESVSLYKRPLTDNEGNFGYQLILSGVKYADGTDQAKEFVVDNAQLTADGKFSGNDLNSNLEGVNVKTSITDNSEGDNMEIMFAVTTTEGVNDVVFSNAPISAGIEKVGAAVVVKAIKGLILINGYNGNAAIYATDGRLVAVRRVDGVATISVAPGLYIVKTGNNATRVVVK